MKYLYRFEEMLESREKIINDTLKVIKEQLELVNYLRKHDEGRFEELAKNLESQVEQETQQMNVLKEKNIHTAKLIDDLKSASKKSVKLVEDLIDELGIFTQQTQEEK